MILSLKIISAGATFLIASVLLVRKHDIIFLIDFISAHIH